MLILFWLGRIELVRVSPTDLGEYQLLEFELRDRKKYHLREDLESLIEGVHES